MLTTYNLITEWLQREPDVDLIIPYIKEEIEANSLSNLEIDALRTRVVFIKKYGHEKYLEAGPDDIACEIFKGSKPVIERQKGSCSARIR